MRMCLNWRQERFIQELSCDSFATASASRPYSSLRTSSCTLVWDPGTRQLLCSPLHMILHYKRFSASMWACFWYKAHTKGLVWSTTTGVEIQGICTKMPLFRACPNCCSQIHVRKLACPCGMNFLRLPSYVLWLGTNATCRGLSTSVLFILPALFRQTMLGWVWLPYT